MKLDTYAAIATLVGTTVGAGILGIPYVVAQSGLAIGLLHILFVGAAIMLVNLFLGEITLRTRATHQISGYVRRYLGSRAGVLATLTMLFSVYGALVAYIIGVGDALAAVFHGDPLLFSIGFWVVSASVVYIGLRAVKSAEEVLTGMVMAVAVAVIALVLFSGRLDAAHLTTYHPANAFLPFGVVLFAFLGATAIPEMREELAKNRKALKKAIIIGGLIPITLYAGFAIAVVGAAGITTSEVATVRLGELLGPALNVLLNVFAVIAMGTSFVAIGLALKEMFLFDFKLHNSSAWVLTSAVPLAVFLLGAQSFIGVLEVVGAVAGGVQGILIVLAHKQSKEAGERTPEYSIPHHGIVSAFVVVLYAAGIAYALLSVAG